MKRIEHYLSEKNNKVYCPLDRAYYCHNGCAWFDHEHQDCKHLGMMWKIVETIRDGNKKPMNKTYGEYDF